MEQHEYEVVYEREFDFIKLIKVMWKHLKMILIFGIIFAVLLGTFYIVNSYRQKSNPDYLKNMEEQYQENLNAYEIDLQQEQKQLERLKVKLNNEIEYNEDSILMSLNPYIVYNQTLQLFLDTGYQISPALQYQNIDKTESAINAYRMAFNNGSFHQFIKNKGFENPRHVFELVNMSTNVLGSINITVQQASEEECNELMLLVKEWLEGQKVKIGNTVVAHDLLLIDETIFSKVDSDIETSQNNVENKITNYKTSIEESEKKIENMKEPVKPANSMISVMSLIKYAFIGGILGVFLTIAIIFVAFLFNTTINDDRDAELYLGLPVIGDIPVAKGYEKKIYNIKRKGIIWKILT